MSAFSLIIRIFLAILCPPLGVIGLKNVGCGTFILLIILTCCFWVPGQIAAIVLIIQDYSSR